MRETRGVSKGRQCGKGKGKDSIRKKWRERMKWKEMFKMVTRMGYRS